MTPRTAFPPRTAAGLIKFRPLEHGGRVAIVAPASPLKYDDLWQFESAVDELKRLDLEPVYDEGVFDRKGFAAGSAERRARELQQMWRRADVQAIIALRGGYGSVQVLSRLDAGDIRQSRTAFVGYSDVTSIHIFLNCQVGLASVHGPMVEGRLARGSAAYDQTTFLRSLSTEPLGELVAPTVVVIRPGEATGPLYGGTLTQLLASFGTPFEFRPERGHILFIDEIGERPYRLHRMLMQLRLSGRLRDASALVFGQLPRCDEPGGELTAADIIREITDDFPGPVLMGFPSGHSLSTHLSLPFGVQTRVVTFGTPRLIVEEAAASA